MQTTFSMLLRGVLDMVLSISSTSILYIKEQCNFDFTISLDIKTNPNILGINFDLDDELLLSLGQLELAIFTRDEAQDMIIQMGYEITAYSKGLTSTSD